MIELLLYANMKCTDAADMIRRINVHDYINNQVKVELVEVTLGFLPYKSLKLWVYSLILLSINISIKY